MAPTRGPTQKTCRETEGGSQGARGQDGGGGGGWGGVGVTGQEDSARRATTPRALLSLGICNSPHLAWERGLTRDQGYKILSYN